MKKLLALLLVLLSLVAICSCSGTPDMSSVNKITYGEKYYMAADMDEPEEERRYYAIYDDGYMDFYYAGDSYEYTVRYKYDVVDESTLVYFYDTLVVHSGSKDVKETDSGMLLFSENVLMTEDGTIYVREGYVSEELPNFGKDD